MIPAQEMGDSPNASSSQSSDPQETVPRVEEQGGSSARSGEGTTLDLSGMAGPDPVSGNPAHSWGLEPDGL